MNAAQSAPAKGRLKQSVSRWCFKDYSLEDLCRESKRIGLVGIDLVLYAAIIMVISAAEPRGIWGLVEKIRRRRSR
jgi:ABC-type branched-subunit amino acid transport system permease subunit